MNQGAIPSQKKALSLNSRAARGLLYQAIALALILALGVFLVANTLENMRTRGIQSGFDFLGSTAGFDIGETTLISYDPSETYAKAIGVGVLNTLRVAIIGIVATTLLGVMIGIGRMSGNALLRGLCYGYVELFRNVPVLLQLLMWYLLFVDLLPPTQNAWNAWGLLFVSKGGFSFPAPVWAPGHAWMLLGAIVGLLAGMVWRRWAHREFERTGRDRNRWALPLGLVLAGAIAGWAAGGAPREWSVPEQLAFMVDGGLSATPEFLAVLIGLVLYTGAFVAEIVRSGIQAVSHGQVEAATALGLTRGQQMRLVILPQALRVIVPPMTSQYLNLTKNSSLAVAVGYPDVVSVANTTLNQSGRAVECIAVIMVVYLSTSLSTSAFMNWYNKRVAIKER
jgi:general L-amino acid transport system permease protein